MHGSCCSSAKISKAVTAAHSEIHSLFLRFNDWWVSAVNMNFYADAAIVLNDKDDSIAIYAGTEKRANP